MQQQRQEVDNLEVKLRKIEIADRDRVAPCGAFLPIQSYGSGTRSGTARAGPTTDGLLTPQGTDLLIYLWPDKGQPSGTLTRRLPGTGRHRLHGLPPFLPPTPAPRVPLSNSKTCVGGSVETPPLSHCLPISRGGDAASTRSAWLKETARRGEETRARGGRF